MLSGRMLTSTTSTDAFALYSIHLPLCIHKHFDGIFDLICSSLKRC